MVPIHGLASADGPVEATGGSRSDVRLLVATPDGLIDRRFTEIGAFLRPGDVLVVNTSATVPAAVPVVDDEDRLVHLSGRQADGSWLAELRRRCARGSEPDGGGHAGMSLRLPGERRLTLVRRFSTPSQTSQRLWVADLRTPTDRPTDPVTWLGAVGHPIRYGCVETSWPLAAYQTVFATHPGSAEMPSAGRPFTDRLVTQLVSAGVDIAPVLLHTGVSSLENDEAPYPEWFSVPATTATRVNRARSTGHRVIAVGTTVVRALESAASAGAEHASALRAAEVQAASGWTDLVISPERGTTVVDGLLTGWHEPASTHLDMLVAVAGGPLVEASYAAAAAGGYRWHEFGDTHLLLPDTAGDQRVSSRAA